MADIGDVNSAMAPKPVTDFDPEAFLAGEAAPAAAPGQSTAFNPEEFLTNDAAKKASYETPAQKALTGVEGAARGISFGLSDAAFKGARGLAEKYSEDPDYWAPKTEDIAKREEENPVTSKASELAGLGAGILSGAGLIGAGMRGAEALTAGVLERVGTNPVALSALENVSLKTAANLSKIGSGALKGAIETGLITGGDEVSKAMLNQTDADPTVATSSALAHTGASSLIGGGIGAGLGAGGVALRRLADTGAANRAADWVTDFGNRWKYNTEAGDLSSKLNDELQTFHGSTKAAADDVYGVNGLKDKTIKALVPEMHEGIINQNEAISNSVNKTIAKMEAKPDSYPPRLVDKLKEKVFDWQNIVTNPNATPHEIFNATQKMKQNFQEWSKFERRVAPLSPESDFVHAAKGIQHDLKEHLEDPEVWGKAAELQKGVNGAFTEFLPAMKDFERRFTSKVGDEAVIDPGKVNTYANQLGKPNAEIKQDIMSNFVDAAEKYRNQISKLHDTLGIENEMAPAPLNGVKGTLNKDLPEGAKAADYIYQKGLNQVTDPVAQKVALTELGAKYGSVPGAFAGYISAHALGPFLNNVVGRPLKGISKYGISALLNVIKNGDMRGIPETLQYANNVSKGADKITKGLDAIFKTSRQGTIDFSVDPKAKEKIKQWIENGGVNKDLPNQTESPQGFAEGGTIGADSDYQDPMSVHYPAQNILLNASKGRVSQYLGGLAPSKYPVKLPFDSVSIDTVKEQKYDKALDIATQPLTILNGIKQGNLSSDDVSHFKSMYPDMHSHLSNKLTERIMNAQMDDETPKYATRQALALFLGRPMDSTMTQPAIQAAQIGITTKPTQQPQQTPNKKSKGAPGKLGKDNASYKTTTQAAESDRSARD